MSEVFHSYPSVSYSYETNNFTFYLTDNVSVELNFRDHYEEIKALLDENFIFYGDVTEYFCSEKSYNDGLRVVDTYAYPGPINQDVEYEEIFQVYNREKSDSFFLRISGKANIFYDVVSFNEMEIVESYEHVATITKYRSLARENLQKD